MKQKRTKPSAPEPEGIRQLLLELRHALLHLHKALVDSERVEYEKTVGAIQSPTQFLQLLTHDPWFVWLHPLSHLIVSMDEALDGKEPLTGAAVADLASQAYGLLVTSEEGDGFSKQYFDALQRDPDVVLAHSEVAKLRARLKPRVQQALPPPPRRGMQG